MTSRIWKQELVAAPGIGISLLPKLICPLCWPAYGALLSTLGLSFLIAAAYLFPITAALLLLAASSLAFRASTRRGLKPFWLALGSAVLVLVGKFYFESPAATYTGVTFLAVASVWNAWPRRANAVGCAGCVEVAGAAGNNQIRREDVQL